MSLATTTQPNGLAIQPTRAVQKPPPVKMDLPQAWDFAGYIADSGMISAGINKPATQSQVFTLMMLCEADGLHMIEAMRQYDIIEGKPAMKAAAVQAKFQAKDGVVTWQQFDENAAVAEFSHPQLQPKPITVAVTYENCLKRGLPNGANGIKRNWSVHRAAMLRARCISAGVRMVYPGIVVGIYTPEEIEDMKESDGKTFDADAYIEANKGGKVVDTTTVAPTQAADVHVRGQRAAGHDKRGYPQIAKEAASEAASELQSYASSIGVVPPTPSPFNSGLIHNAIAKACLEKKLTDKKPAGSVESLNLIVDTLYPSHRDQVRMVINSFLDSQLVDEKVKLQPAKASEAPADDEAGWIKEDGEVRQ